MFLKYFRDPFISRGFVFVLRKRHWTKLVNTYRFRFRPNSTPLGPIGRKRCLQRSFVRFRNKQMIRENATLFMSVYTYTWLGSFVIPTHESSNGNIIKIHVFYLIYMCPACRERKSEREVERPVLTAYLHYGRGRPFVLCARVCDLINRSADERLPSKSSGDTRRYDRDSCGVKWTLLLSYKHATVLLIAYEQYYNTGKKATLTRRV